MKRRDLLKGALTSGIIAAAPAIVTSRTQRWRLNSHSPSIAPTGALQFSDLFYKGLFLLPNDAGTTNWGFSGGAITGRLVGGNIHLFVCGRQSQAGGGDGAGLFDNPYEINYPGVGSSIGTAPRATLITNWGTTFQNNMPTAVGGGEIVSGIIWDPDINGMWAAYTNYYNGAYDPSIACVIFDDVHGTATGYGPWRTTESNKKTCGFLVSIPSYFRTYTTSGNRKFAVGAPIVSLAAACNKGTSLLAFPNFNPITTPADSTTDTTQQTLDCQRLIFHDLANPQQRNTNYKICLYNDNVTYNCASGTTVYPGPGDFGNAESIDPGFGAIRDKVSAAAWVKTATKEGVVVFGEITDVVAGVNYGTDTVPHLWYGPSSCCHGQTGFGTSGTGPSSPSQAPMGYLFSPDQMRQAALGLINPWFEPYATTRVDAIASGVPSNVGGQWTIQTFGGAWFESVSRLLFVSQTQADTITNSFQPRPVIHVFQVVN